MIAIAIAITLAGLLAFAAGAHLGARRARASLGYALVCEGLNRRTVDRILAESERAQLIGARYVDGRTRAAYGVKWSDEWSPGSDEAGPG